MPKRAMPGDYRHAEYLLENYNRYLQELKEREDEYAMRFPESGYYSLVQCGKTADTTGNAGVRIALDRRIAYLRMATRAVAQALFDLSEKPNGFAIAMLVKLIYWDKTQTLEGAAQKSDTAKPGAAACGERSCWDVMRGMGWDANDLEKCEQKKMA